MRIVSQFLYRRVSALPRYLHCEDLSAPRQCIFWSGFEA